MNLNLNPKLITVLAELATAHNTTSEEYATRVLDKYLLGQLRTNTQAALSHLTVDELKKVKTDVEAIRIAKIQNITEPIK